ncbi:Phosphate transporter PHO1 homolog 1 [Linum perenne]
MVKFSKQFEGQLVPEWKEAFVDYWKLKKDLKKFPQHHHSASTATTTSSVNNGRSYLATKLATTLKKLSHFSNRGHHGAINFVFIQVHKKLASSLSKGDMYETELLDQFEDSEAAKEFFSCLDLQLNKVNQFFKTKEKEFVERGDSLKKQMDILIELKSALKHQHQVTKGSSADLDDDDTSFSCTISCDAEDSVEKEEEENGSEEAERATDESTMDSPRSGELGGEMRTLSGRVFSCQGKSMRLNIPLTTPLRTFSAISYLVWGDSSSSKKCSNPEGSNRLPLHINKTKLHHAEKMIRGAFIELYKGLGYLKTYRNLNMLAFIKILKKFDKVIKVTLFLLNILYVLLLLLSSVLMKDMSFVLFCTPSGYWKASSMFSLIFLHFFMYGCNIFMWRKTRINYSFIFELAPTKDLKYRDVFLICTTSMTVVLGIMFGHLSLMSKGYSYSHIQAIPGLLLLAFMLLLVCPFNIFYQSSRYRFLCVIRNIILSPLYKVVMLDFFMADQLCSQVPMLRNLEYVACYYVTGSYKTQDYNYCMRAGHYRDLSYAVSFLPYYWRAMQCARRWFDEGETSHLVNLGKYVSAMLAAGAKVAYEKDSSLGWLCVVVAMSSAATIYQLYWDFVKDWGLLQMDSKNPWLRNELMLRQKFIYYFSMGLNMVLRLAWLQTVLHSSFEHVDYRVTGLFLAALEVIRRGHWNFYRLENEHLNNAGKFRAVKTVPLPFHEVDEQD